MQFKRALENKKNPVSNIPPYKLAIKSLRPNSDFMRESDKYNKMTQQEKFISDAYRTLDVTNFNAVDSRCQNGEYERYVFVSCYSSLLSHW